MLARPVVCPFINALFLSLDYGRRAQAAGFPTVGCSTACGCDVADRDDHGGRSTSAAVDLLPLWLSAAAARWAALLVPDVAAAIHDDALAAFGRTLSRQLSEDRAFAASLQALVAAVLGGACEGDTAVLHLTAPGATQGLLQDLSTPVASL